MTTIKDFTAEKSEVILSNGSHLIVLNRPGMPVYLRAAFLSGSRFDPEGKEGLAHFIEHMLVAGTEHFPTKDKLASYIERFGGDIGASTGGEMLNINVSVGDPNDLKEAVKILGEILNKPLFDEESIENERGSILRELGDRNSTPREIVWDVYRKLFFQGTSVGRSILGSMDSINNIRKQDLVKFYKSLMTSGRMVIVISGGIGIEEVKELAEQELLVPVSEKITFSQDLAVLREDSVLIEPYSNTPQVHLVFGFRAANAFSSDIPVLNLIAEVLGGGRAAILTKKLRYEKGLVYGVGCQTVGMSDGGSFIVKTSTSKDKLQELLDITTAEISKISQNGLIDEDISFAKEKMIKSKREQMQTSSSWVNFHSTDELIGKKDWSLTKYIEEISSVTSEQTKLVAQKYFGENNWYLAVCGDITKDQTKVIFKS